MKAYARHIAAAPDSAIAATMLVTWIVPQLIGVGWVTYAAPLLVIEFVVVHSAVAILYLGALTPSRVLNGVVILGLSALYSVLALVVARGFDSMWPFWSFWILTANRLFTLLGPAFMNDRRQAQLGTRWVVSTLLYVAWVFVSMLPLPSLGIDPSMVPQDSRTGGLWVEQPQRALAAAAGYFGCQAWLDLKQPRWMSEPVFRRRSMYG